MTNESEGPEQRRKQALFDQEECRRAIGTKDIEGWTESRTRIASLGKRLREQFVERDLAVNGILAALISRAGCVLLGPPGTAKSLLVNRIARECDLRIGTEDANYFEYLLTAHTMPEEIFGPTDIGLLLLNPPQVQRHTEARLPHAELAFLDEVFRGGSHILNTLLSILNERRFHNGRRVEEVPLVSFIGAANHPPQTEELRAFFDRFPVRIWVDSVLRSESTRLKNAQRLIDVEAPPTLPKNVDRPSMHDFRKLWSILRRKLRHSDTGNRRANEGLDRRLNEFTRLFAAFQAEGQLSDRSFVQLWYFAGALDMVEGREPDLPSSSGGLGHFHCFYYVAPSQPSLASIEHRVNAQLKRQSASGV